jgi:hypothetical protein
MRLKVALIMVVMWGIVDALKRTFFAPLITGRHTARPNLARTQAGNEIARQYVTE